jgi:nucleotide-binding universal stress UspA family protein
MIKTVLASLTGHGSDKAALDAAIAVAKIDGGHVNCLHVRIDAVQAAAVVGAAGTNSNLHENAQSIAREEQALSQQARSVFQDACQRHALPVARKPGEVDGPSVSFSEVTSLFNETLHQARTHDLLVIARDPELSSERLHSLVMQSGRPVLIAPTRPLKSLGGLVVIAWKDGPEAARALSAALPILVKASRVIILTVSEDGAGDDADLVSAEGVARQLGWHGIEAEVQMSYAPVLSASLTIQEISSNLDADLLVMGAYGHSRLREFVFGGATRDILLDYAMPVFMLH